MPLLRPHRRLTHKPPRAAILLGAFIANTLLNNRILPQNLMFLSIKDCPCRNNSLNLHNSQIVMKMGKYINRIKVVLAEQRKTNLWLARELGKDPATVSKWCTNTAQPSLETLTAIAKCLNVDIRSLLNSTNDAMVAETSISFGSYEGK